MDKINLKNPLNQSKSGFRNDYYEKSKKLKFLAPGPGQYRLPSEFGYYVDKNFLSKATIK